MAKIPFNQVDFQTINWGCVTGCDTDNEEKFQLLIDKLCETVNFSEVDLKCLSTTRKDNIIDILNLIIPKICTATSSTTGTTIDLSKITLCGKDNSSYTYEECLTILNTCFPTLTIEAILQAVIKRLNTYSFLISQLKLQLDALGLQYSTLRTELDQLKIKQDGCCP